MWIARFGVWPVQAASHLRVDRFEDVELRSPKYPKSCDFLGDDIWKDLSASEIAGKYIEKADNYNDFISL